MVKEDKIYRPEFQGKTPVAFRLIVQGDMATGKGNVMVEGLSLLEGQVSLGEFERALNQAKTEALETLSKLGLSIEAETKEEAVS